MAGNPPQTQVAGAHKRLHIGLKVADIGESVEFYSRLFGVAPTLLRDDYAKWMLDDPRVNFSIDLKGPGGVGSAHYGIQVDDLDGLAAARAAVDEAGLVRADQDDVTCCHHTQTKSWLADPNGLPWELFFTHDVADDYGHETMPVPDTVCCVGGPADGCQ